MWIELLLRKYQTSGRTSWYHPEMMTKLFVYGYKTKSVLQPDAGESGERT
ncbi:MAG: hypothetical protein LBU18_01890 [Treponema sp.]|nr:hypothetical protein [Treponema sp.]